MSVPQKPGMGSGTVPRCGPCRHPFWRFLPLTLGAFFVAFGFSRFFLPHHIIDAGVNGLAMLLAYRLHLFLPALVLFFNAPFLYLGYREFGGRFVLGAGYALLALAFFLGVLAPPVPLTESPILASIFGGLFVGLGIGLILRGQGSVDGMDLLALVLSERTDFSVGEIALALNAVVFALAAFLLSPESGMYSALAYYVAFRTVDVVLQGLDESRSVLIVTSAGAEIAEAVGRELGRTVTRFAVTCVGERVEPRTALYIVLTRLEIERLKSLVLDYDPEAIVVVENVHDVVGAHTLKRPVREGEE
ncbi:MAG: putative membrane protein [Brockia lithotrophica]|uniref:Putative membrane protein n=1 Tax=Brockia lithotrophica TaxID=933949 RepID=A0A2T5GAB3_9BACL|nr:YitT family protein [Brockia lithotrophica]MBT9252327.1 YitT family protein [Brockia lithotrophica]PTQ53133.1 MAG: putative membrane protein [Brockia lithotrophica]